MLKTWLVAKHEYLDMVRRRAFVLSTIGVPLLIVIVVALSIFIAVGDTDTRPLGYVDQAGVLAAEPRRAAGPSTVAIRPYPDLAAAQAALQAGEIQAAYLLPADYLQTGRLRLLYLAEPPDGSVRGDFNALLRANLLTAYPEAVRQRLAGGVDLTVRSADGSRQFHEGDVAAIVLPFLAGFFFMFAVLASSGYLLQAVSNEKENRTVELMATSLSALQLIGGKAVGLLGVTLTQIAIWVAAAVLGVVIGAGVVPELRSLSTPWGLLALAVLYFLPSYALMAGLMITVGSMVSEQRHGQQIAGLLNMFFVLPFFFAVLVFTDPDSPIMVALTLFPTTSFITVLLRWGATTVPAWQLAASWLILVSTAVLTIWIAARVFRVGMLRYGKALDLRAALAAVRAGGR